LSYTLKWNNESINSWKTQKKASTQIIMRIFFRSFVCIDKMDLRYWHHLVLQMYMDWFLAYFEDTMWNLHITISPWKRNFHSLKCKHNMNIFSYLISFLKFCAPFVKDCMSCLNLLVIQLISLTYLCELISFTRLHMFLVHVRVVIAFMHLSQHDRRIWM
jgi:hypothetical protein